ncbi:hypothetical protein TWF225_006012 [Orbilia oligospora]|nr:hypothetical protein TWF751_000409 [Orbilia oligospora]KAF3184334.1 hypothetical protein TWF225_006012 [Orbilia oligospora]KAF3253407.1 hypothetical protein TWF128_006489 [Orbilia oligospora]KAF3263353.1 hypothetical protein TWF217_003763 [Orbilia oligospora]KAF3294995.1 hypothetical protein TWF132_002326 [Orbilia oligospora]
MANWSGDKTQALGARTMHDVQQMRSDRDGDILELRQIPPFDKTTGPDSGHDRSDPGSSGYTSIQASQFSLGNGWEGSNGSGTPHGYASPSTSSGINRIYGNLPDPQGTERPKSTRNSHTEQKTSNAKSWSLSLGNNRFSREVPWQGVRDHLALERTFLGWLRTSGAFAMTGVLLAQISVIVHKNEEEAMKLGLVVEDSPSEMPSIHDTARTLSALTVGIALVTMSIGVLRFYFGQKALIEGLAVSGGWPIIGLAVFVLGYLLTVLLLMVISSDP